MRSGSSSAACASSSAESGAVATTSSASTRARELVDRICGDQAERAIHSRFLSSSVRETLIGANGAACSSEISPALRSSSSARKATAWSMRGSVRSRRRGRSGAAGGAAPGSARGSATRAEIAAACARARPAAAARASRRERRREPLGILGAAARRRRRERGRPDAEVAVALAGEALREPGGRLLHAAVLGQAPRELLRRLLGLELGELRLLVREQRARLQLEQRRDQHEELAAGLEIELVPLGEPLDEGDHDRGHVDVGRLELLPQEERQQQVEGTLERVEVQLELAHFHRGRNASRGVGRGRAGPPSSAAARPCAHAAAGCGSSSRMNWAQMNHARARMKTTAATSAFVRTP